MTYEDIGFGHVFSEELRLSESAEKSNVVLYKQFDEKRNNYKGDFNVESLKSFVDSNSFPLVMPFNDRAIQKVFQQSTPTLFLFSNDNEASVAAEVVFTEAAHLNKGKIAFSVSKLNDGFGHYQRLAEYVGANTAKAPVLILVHSSEEVLKYQFPSREITVATITSFIDEFKSGKLSTFMKSEDIPERNDEPVKVLVGKSFDEIVRNTHHDVLVEFYAPWCGHCKTLTPIYDLIAKKIQHNKNIVLAKIDSTANEVVGLNISGFPTIKFFRNGSKNAPIDFEGERTEEGIIKYLREKTTHPWIELKDEL